MIGSVIIIDVDLGTQSKTIGGGGSKSKRSTLQHQSYKH